MSNTQIKKVMNIEKPDWTPLELSEKTARHRLLLAQVMDHDDDCQCNRCMECFGLGELTSLFSEDEHTAAVIAARQEAARKSEA